ncbi:MAG: PD40 domain-containing protein [Thermodesulfovibrionia bacterium]|nr:PD40 domain-containing protein [Thermodesulfovibrionia bacterium]
MNTDHKCSIKQLLVFLIWTVVAVLWVNPPAEAKVYIDITAPAIRKLPVSITAKGSPRAKEIKWIVKNDLETTGMFEFIDPDIPGAEITAKIVVELSERLKILLSVNDLIEDREVLRKRFESPKKNVRAVAHIISNDIYKMATGKKGIFRTKISYLANSSSGRKELSLMDWDGYSSRKIVSKGLTASHSWSNDGRYIIYSAARNRKWRIYFLDLERHREKVMFSSKGLNLVGGASAEDIISFSSSRDGSPEIYVMNIHGKGLKKLTRSFGIDVSPVFSPDGGKIAFVSDRGGSPQVYTMDSKGRGIKRLTFEGPYNTSPSWSPDGKWVAFVGRKDGKNQIFMVQSVGMELRQLTFSGNNEGPAFSPDGLFLSFDSDRDGNRGIYIMRTDGTGQKRITPRYKKAMSPKWSPYFK